MLHKNSAIISPETFSLLKRLQSFSFLHGFHLVGGTALALQIGHRNSIDLDLFSQDDFRTHELIEHLNKHFKVTIDLERHNTVLSNLDDVKVDFITHDYPYINPPLKEYGLTFLSKEDIAAMKLNAVIQSGKRLKDFIDIFYLLEYFSMNDMLNFFEIKYAHVNPLVALKAVNYFKDIDETIDPPKLLKSVSINQIKRRIESATLHTHKIFKYKD